MNDSRSLPLVRRIAALGILLATLAARSAPAEELQGPLESQRLTARVVAAMLEQNHYSHHRLDDDIVAKWMHSYLKSFDPWKLYFEQSDIRDFEPAEREIARQVQQGNLDFAFRVYNRFLKRVDERQAVITEWLAADHDFTKDESMVTDPDQLDYASKPEEIRERWRKRIKYDLLVLKLDGKNLAEAKTRVARRYRDLARRSHQFDADEVVEGYLNALAGSFDPHSNYMSPRIFDELNISLSLSLEGIGAALKSEDGETIVSEVVPGGPADLDKRLKPNDRIVAVSGPDGKMIETSGMKLSDVVKLIRGKSGTQVRLQVVSAGQHERKLYVLTRSKVELKNQEARGTVIEHGKTPEGRPYRLGVINLPSFYAAPATGDLASKGRGGANALSATNDLRRILQKFKQEGVDGVVIDLRANGGGLLSEAISVSNLFVGPGPVVQVKNSRGRIEQLEDKTTPMVYDGPLVVMISRLSASASEIFAGVIQDYHRGLIVGDVSSHGKGTAQSVVDLRNLIAQADQIPPMGAIKLTTQKFYRVNGDSTQYRGVQSDVHLPSLVEHLDQGERHLDNALPYDRIVGTEHVDFDRVNSRLIEQLQERSQARRQKSKDFQQLEEAIRRYEERNGSKTVSLNEAQMREEMKLAGKKEKKGQAVAEESLYNQPIWDKTFYTEEILSIAQDYIKLSANAKVVTSAPAAAADQP